MGQQRSRRMMLASGSALTLGIGTLAAATNMFFGAGAASACNQYIQPGNPYTNTCGIPGGPPAAIGGSPSATAIIACRGIPGCLAYSVNGPGFVKVPQVDNRVRQSQ
ncbi:MAG: hypothetical protein ABW137_03770 [Mycobacterium sp.]